MAIGTCRFCKKWDGELLMYGPRHYAHAACLLDKKKLSDLHPRLILQLPYKMLKERGLLVEAAALTKKIAVTA